LRINGVMSLVLQVGDADLRLCGLKDNRQEKNQGRHNRGIDRGDPSSATMFTLIVATPVALMKMNCVENPPPSAICGKMIGDGAGCVESATGNVVRRISPRPFVSDRS